MKHSGVLARASRLARVTSGVPLDGMGSPEVIGRFFCLACIVIIVFWKILGINSAVLAGAVIAGLILVFAEVFGDVRDIPGANPFRGRPVRRAIAFGLCCVAFVFITAVAMAFALVEFVEPSQSLALDLVAFCYVGGMWIVEHCIRAIRLARAR
jgi:hypothetical protein